MNLEGYINQGCDDLRWITEALARGSRPGTLGSKSYDYFNTSIDLAGQLEQAKEMIIVREVALGAAKMFPNQQSQINPAKFMYHGVEVAFKQGRFLVLQSYLATTWALYDAVAKIAGVLCCVDELAKNPVSPIKLQEHFLRGSNCVGSHVQDHVKGGYGRPIAISYAIRNWVVHDGHSQNGLDLFDSDSPTGAPYRLSARAWAKIKEKIAAEYNTRLRPFPGVQDDVLQGLMACHEEIDEAIGFILCWSTGAARLQAQILLPRDVIAVPLPAMQASVSSVARVLPNGTDGTAPAV